MCPSLARCFLSVGKSGESREFIEPVLQKSRDDGVEGRAEVHKEDPRSR